MKKTTTKKKKSMNYLIYAVVAVLVLLAIFWPKTSSKSDDYFTVANGEFIKNYDCQCIGFTAPQNNCLSCTQYTDCYGIPTSCQYSCKRLIGDMWQDEPCERI